MSATSLSPIVCSCRPARSFWRARQRSASLALSASMDGACGTGVRKLAREYFTSPSTFPLSGMIARDVPISTQPQWFVYGETIRDAGRREHASAGRPSKDMGCEPEPLYGRPCGLPECAASANP